MPDQRPLNFLVSYNGGSLQFSRMGTDGRYYVTCPKCHARRGDVHFGMNAINVESENGWSLTFDDQGRATVRPSILCRSRWAGEPGECGWHVVIENGVARDV